MDTKKTIGFVLDINPTFNQKGISNLETIKDKLVEFIKLSFEDDDVLCFYTNNNSNRTFESRGQQTQIIKSFTLQNFDLELALKEVMYHVAKEYNDDLKMLFLITNKLNNSYLIDKINSLIKKDDLEIKFYCLSFGHSTIETQINIEDLNHTLENLVNG